MAEKELTQEEIREKLWEQNRAKNYAPSSKGRVSRPETLSFQFRTPGAHVGAIFDRPLR